MMHLHIFGYFTEGSITNRQTPLDRPRWIRLRPDNCDVSLLKKHNCFIILRIFYTPPTIFLPVLFHAAPALISDRPGTSCISFCFCTTFGVFLHTPPMGSNIVHFHLIMKTITLPFFSNVHGHNLSFLSHFEFPLFNFFNCDVILRK